MTISGFTMVRNATKLYYPIKQAILSILPLVDEFVVALGNCDDDDFTQLEIESIQSDKIRIIHTVWDLEKYPNGMEHAHQTDIAKSHCTGDWLFYLQSDEVVHEKYLPIIKQRCEELLDDKSIEGLLFEYRHFWGDYNHYIISHAWYANEIRIVRNNKDIHSWESAQSFRRIPEFDGVHYRQQKNTFKLKVAKVNACINHYGWVRPPAYMQVKRKVFTTIHRGLQSAEELFRQEEKYFNYGDLTRLTVLNDSHPVVMQEVIQKFDWQNQLYPSRPPAKKKHKHERLKYRLLTYVEQHILAGKQIFAFKNYNLTRF